MSERVVRHRFGSWQEGLEAAGLTLSSLGRRYTDDDYYENLLAVWVHHRRAPIYREMNEPPSRISAGAYENKFGTWTAARLAFLDLVNSDVAAAKPARVLGTRARQSARAADHGRSIAVGVRYDVMRRDRFRCVLCGAIPALELGVNLHVDHIVPLAEGGTRDPLNLRTLCDRCNLGKGRKIEN